MVIVSKKQRNTGSWELLTSQNNDFRKGMSASSIVSHKYPFLKNTYSTSLN